MNPGDLVRMKYEMYWHLKSNPRIDYTEKVASVITCGSHIMEIMWPDGRIEQRDKDIFEVISESR